MKLHAGIALIFALMAFGALRFPASIRNGELTGASGSFLVLLAYAAISEWVRRTSAKTVRAAADHGAMFGGMIAVFAIVNHSLEEFANLQPPFPAILGVSMWGVMFLLFGGASSIAFRETDSVRLGVLASVSSALVSTIGTVTFAFSVGLIFMPHMERLLAPAFAASGMTDPAAFVIRNLFDSEFEHLLVAPTAAVVIGIASGVACATLRTTGRRTAIVLGILGIVLFRAGIAALELASSMERSSRPPFVMFGLSALGVTLASAFPIIAAIRSPGLIENQ